MTSAANQIRVSHPFRSSRMSCQASAPVASIAPTPAIAVAVALMPSALPSIQKVNRKTNTARRTRSSRVIGPISRSRSRANAGASGVWVTSGGYRR